MSSWTELKAAGRAVSLAMATPPGWHRAKLTGCERATSKAGNRMLVWAWQLLCEHEGNAEGYHMRHWNGSKGECGNATLIWPHLEPF